MVREFNLGTQIALGGVNTVVFNVDNSVRNSLTSDSRFCADSVTTRSVATSEARR
jgi:hypothetical protein